MKHKTQCSVHILHKRSSSGIISPHLFISFGSSWHLRLMYSILRISQEAFATHTSNINTIIQEHVSDTSSYKNDVYHRKLQSFPWSCLLQGSVLCYQPAICAMRSLINNSMHCRQKTLNTDKYCSCHLFSSGQKLRRY